MNSFKKLSLFLLVTVLVASCDDFGSINTDPNNPSSVKTELLLTNALRNISGSLASVTPVLYVQHMSETQYNEASRYQGVNYDFSGYYTGPLKDLQTIIDLNTDEATRDNVVTGGSNANQIAVARILKAYFYHIMTDRWGALPYSEALQGSDNFSPAYDTQAAIYSDLIAELKAAVAQIDGGAGVAGDFLFDGDMAQWEAFANTLRMRIALRMSEASPATAATEFASAINDGVITSDVMYPYLAESANQNPWYGRFQTRTDYAISDVLADTMITLSDMRVTAFADPAPVADNANGTTEIAEVVGLDYTLEDPGEVPNSDVSFPGQAIRAQNAPLAIFSMAEVNLSMAEAVERTWIAGNSATLYAAGIQASWEQWGVYDATNLATYMGNAEVTWAGTGTAAAMDQIAYEKWVALYGNGYEAWAEWRRLDHPTLTPHPFPLNSSGQIPVRHAYPATEANLNETSYNNAVNAQGPDDTTTNLWWDN